MGSNRNYPARWAIPGTGTRYNLLHTENSYKQPRMLVFRVSWRAVFGTRRCQFLFLFWPAGNPEADNGTSLNKPMRITCSSGITGMIISSLGDMVGHAGNYSRGAFSHNGK